MDQLISKIANLGYEVFGIFLPGIIFGIFVIFWWVALGPIAPHLSDGFFPAITSDNSSKIVESISARTGAGIAIPTIIFSYFFGHLLNWIGRKGKADNQATKSSTKRTWESLKFKIPKPENSYDTDLKDMYELVSKKMSASGEVLTWTQFYPVAKNYIQRKSNVSLVALYQNKYTFYRSITTAAAALFWLCLATALTTAIFGCHANFPSPRWGMLTTLFIVSITITWGFSGSYAYNWKLFGNSIITEAYALIFEPKNDEKPAP